MSFFKYVIVISIIIFTAAYSVEILQILTDSGHVSGKKQSWMSWIGSNLWMFLLVIVAAPFILGLIFDGNGQSASGWLILVGALISIIFGGFYLIYLVGIFIIRMIF